MENKIYKLMITERIIFTSVAYVLYYSVHRPKNVESLMNKVIDFYDAQPCEFVLCQNKHFRISESDLKKQLTDLLMNIPEYLELDIDQKAGIDNIFAMIVRNSTMMTAENN